MHTILQDLRYALRQLRRSPGFALTAILTLALGIGANAAIFTLIDDALLRALPVQRPAELVTVGFHTPAFEPLVPAQSLAALDELRRRLTTVQGLSGWSPDMLSIADDHGTLRSLSGEMVSGDAMAMLGVRPYLGRLIEPGDDVPGGPTGGWPALLGYGFWQANFHGDTGILGHRIRVSGQPVTVVGVLPPDFDGIFVGQPERLVLPMHFLSAMAATPDLDVYRRPEKSQVMVLGRLRPGCTLSQLNAELAAIAPAEVHRLMPEQWRTISGFQKAWLSAESESRGFGWLGQQYRQPLLLLQGIMLLVLLLCCVNLAAVQLARVASRAHEFAIRSALGATRRRILSQSLIESLLLASAGSLLAACIAWPSTGALGTFLTPAGSTDPTLLRPDARVFAFTSALAVITTLLFGLAPAYFACRTSPAAALKTGGTHRRNSTLRQRILIPTQFALALVLVFGAGLFAQTLIRLRTSHAGFDPTRITMVTAQFQSIQGKPAQIATLYRSMTDTLRASPGVEAAAYTWVTPLTGWAPKITVRPLGPSQRDQQMVFNDVGDGYFAAMRTGVLAGREFLPADRDRSTCVINQAAARVMLPTGAASTLLGATLRATNERPQVAANCRVVGIVEDARYASLRDPAPPTLYFPAGAPDFSEGGYTNNLVFLIRSHTLAEATAAYRGALARFAPQTGYVTFLPLSQQIDQSLGSERLIALLSSSFAAIALLLSAVGLFGALALRVQQRVPEFGVRLAVGATRSNLQAIVLREAATMVGVGSAAGVLLAAAGTVSIRRFLYGTSSTTPAVGLAALAALFLSALLAALLPARRAASTDPIKALRSE